MRAFLKQLNLPGDNPALWLRTIVKLTDKISVEQRKAEEVDPNCSADWGEVVIVGKQEPIPFTLVSVLGPDEFHVEYLISVCCKTCHDHSERSSPGGHVYSIRAMRMCTPAGLGTIKRRLSEPIDTANCQTTPYDVNGGLNCWAVGPVTLRLGGEAVTPVPGAFWRHALTAMREHGSGTPHLAERHQPPRGDIL